MKLGRLFGKYASEKKEHMQNSLVFVLFSIGVFGCNSYSRYDKFDSL